MNETGTPSTEIISIEHLGYDFIPPEFLTAGKDEHWLRNIQQGEHKKWRNLSSKEIEVLLKNGNRCRKWEDFLVSDPFEPELILRSSFYGLIRLDALRGTLIRHHDFCVPSGIRDSNIVSCDIGDDCAIQNCSYISHYIIAKHCVLSRIDEMQATNHAKFGNGAIKDGEDEEVRIWIDVMNEAGGRSVLPFAEMICADAFLWASYRDDTALAERLKEITQKQYGGNRGSYGTIGAGTVIKSCRIIKDVAVGSGAYIKGANKLKNLTILSSEDESSQIGEGVELVNGIVGYGCHAFYGSKAVRFVMGRNCSLKYGARLIHSVLGDNSTVSCCEILNNLIFPMHEQHHNNSFLIASLLQGQSNMAAASTIGSNHNSRENDGELRAGRGFWPGLAVSLKHSSCFASFVIIVKGDYPAELNIPFPFALVSNNVHKNRLEVLPAYFWMYNLYALERTSWKGRARDKRKNKIQRIETDYLAPDTAEEIIAALGLLETWLAEASACDKQTLPEEIKIIPGHNLERGKRPQAVLKPVKAIAAYCSMLRYYALKTLAAFFDSHSGLDFNSLIKLLGSGDPAKRIRDWVNMGGQIVPAFRVNKLREQVREGQLNTWQEIHGVYDSWYADYPLDKAHHAWSVLALLRARDRETSPLDAAAFKEELSSLLEIRQWLALQIYESRAKDFRDPFKKAVYRSQEEMDKVVGTVESGKFIKQAEEENTRFKAMIERVQSKFTD